MIVFACASVCVLVYMYVYQCVVTCFPVSGRDLAVNIWGPQTMRAYISVGFIFLEIRKKEQFWILSLESVTSTKDIQKPDKGSLSSSRLFVTSLHTFFCFWYILSYIKSINNQNKMYYLHIVTYYSPPTYFFQKNRYC